MGKGSIPHAQQPQATHTLRVETSAYGLVIPLVYGENRVAGNVLWMDNFQAHQHSHSSGAKGGGRVVQVQYSYTVHVAIGIAEGLLSHAAGYQDLGTAYVGVGSMTQKAHPRLTHLPHGVWTTKRVKYAGNPDTPTDGGEVDRSGAGFETFVVPSGPWANTEVFVSPVFGPGAPDTQLSGIFGGGVDLPPINYYGTAVMWARGLDLGSNASLPQFNFPFIGLLPYYQVHSLSDWWPHDACPADIARDLLTNAKHGVTDWPTSALPDWHSNTSSWGAYCHAIGCLVSPIFDSQRTAASMLEDLAAMSHTAIVWSEGQLKMIPYGDTAIDAVAPKTIPGGAGIPAGMLGTYDPSPWLVNRADLGLADFLHVSEADPIVEVERFALKDLWNHVRVECVYRENAYASQVEEARDEAHISIHGLRSKEPYKYSAITRPQLARDAAQRQLQRFMGVRATYKFRLSWRYLLLEPMDVVTLTEPGVGLYLTPVRITAMEEQNDGSFKVEAEDFPGEVGRAVSYTSQQPRGPSAEFNAAAGLPRSPVIFEPPAGLVDAPELWIATSGDIDNWGGCSIFLAFEEDGEYAFVGQLNGRCRHGWVLEHLTPAASTEDTATTFTALLEDGGELLSGTVQQARTLERLLYLGNGGNDYELCGYSQATFLGTEGPNARRNKYTVGGFLSREAYGTRMRDVNRPVLAVCDERVARIPLEVGWLGRAVWLKLVSHNPYGGGVQAVEDVPATRFMLDGKWVLSALPTVTGLRTVFVEGALALVWEPISDPRLGTPNTVVTYEVRVGAAWASARVVTRQTETRLPIGQDGLWWVRACLRVDTPRGPQTVYSEDLSSVLVEGAILTDNALERRSLAGLAGWTHPLLRELFDRGPVALQLFDQPAPADLTGLGADGWGMDGCEGAPYLEPAVGGAGPGGCFVRWRPADVELGAKLAVGPGILPNDPDGLPALWLQQDPDGSFPAAYAEGVIFPTLASWMANGGTIVVVFQRAAAALLSEAGNAPDLVTVGLTGGNDGTGVDVLRVGLTNDANGAQLALYKAGAASTTWATGGPAIPSTDRDTHVVVIQFAPRTVPGMTYGSGPWTPTNPTTPSTAGRRPITYRAWVDGVEAFSGQTTHEAAGGTASDMYAMLGSQVFVGCRGTAGLSRSMSMKLALVAAYDTQLAQADVDAIQAAFENPQPELIRDETTGAVQLAALGTFDGMVGDVDDQLSIAFPDGARSSGRMVLDPRVAGAAFRGEVPARTSAALEGSAFVPGAAVFDHVANVDRMASVDGVAVGYVSMLLHEQHGHAVAGLYDWATKLARPSSWARYDGTWHPFTPGVQTMNRVRWLLELATTDPQAVPVATGGEVVVDVLDRTERGSDRAAGIAIDAVLGTATATTVFGQTTYRIPVLQALATGERIIVAVAWYHPTGIVEAPTVALASGVSLGPSDTNVLAGLPTVSTHGFTLAGSVSAGDEVLVTFAAAAPAAIVALAVENVGGFDQGEAVRGTVPAGGRNSPLMSITGGAATGVVGTLAVAAFGWIGGARDAIDAVAGELIARTGTDFVPTHGVGDVQLAVVARVIPTITAPVVSANLRSTWEAGRPWVAGMQVIRPAGASIRVTFATPFHAPPAVQVTVRDAQAGDEALVSNVTPDGFDLVIKNAGTTVSRAFDWMAQGA